MQIHAQRALFAEIIRGWSLFSFNSLQLRLKHLTPILVGDITTLYLDIYNQAAKKIPSEQDKLDYLLKTKAWTKNDEEELKNHEQLIEGLEKNKKLQFLKSLIDQFSRDIRREKTVHSIKYNKKMNLLGLTAERYAFQKLQAEYIYNSIYQDNKLYFKREEFDNLSQEEFQELEQIYTKIIIKFNTENLQKLALSNYMQNLYSLCDDKVSEFYGRPLIYCTNFQEELFRWLRYFSFILKDIKNPPNELMEDPERLIDYYVKGKNLENVLGKGNNRQNLSIVGATKSDLSNVNTGGYSQLNEMIAKAKREGKTSIGLSDMSPK